MSIKVTTTYTRPNTSVNFFMNTAAQQEHRKQTYFDTNKMIMTISISEDQLKKTIINEFPSSSNYIEYINDPIISGEIKNSQLYNLENGISMSVFWETT